MALVDTAVDALLSQQPGEPAAPRRSSVSKRVFLPLTYVEEGELEEATWRPVQGGAPPGAIDRRTASGGEPPSPSTRAGRAGGSAQRKGRLDDKTMRWLEQSQAAAADHFVTPLSRPDVPTATVPSMFRGNEPRLHTPRRGTRSSHGQRGAVVAAVAARPPRGRSPQREPSWEPERKWGTARDADAAGPEKGDAMGPKVWQILESMMAPHPAERRVRPHQPAVLVGRAPDADPMTDALRAAVDHDIREIIAEGEGGGPARAGGMGERRLHPVHKVGHARPSGRLAGAKRAVPMARVTEAHAAQRRRDGAASARQQPRAAGRAVRRPATHRGARSRKEMALETGKHVGPASPYNINRYVRSMWDTDRAAVSAPAISSPSSGRIR